MREDFSHYDKVLSRYDEVMCDKASKFSVEEIKLQTKESVQYCEKLVKDTCDRISFL